MYVFASFSIVLISNLGVMFPSGISFSDEFFRVFILKINPFQFSAAIHIETSHLICSTNQMTGFYIKRNTLLK